MIKIPPEVVDAAAKELLQQFLFLYLDEHRDPYEWQDLPEPAKERLREVARAAFLAMLEAWPNAKTLRDDGRRQTYVVPALILPLPQEAPCSSS